MDLEAVAGDVDLTSRGERSRAKPVGGSLCEPRRAEPDGDQRNAPDDEDDQSADGAERPQS